MHASKIINSRDFRVTVKGNDVSLAEVFPQWTAADRVGIVVHEPFGALGASLLLQAGVSFFYAADPARIRGLAQYPPIFLFHVGGRHGDHSPLDFWPSRREIFLPDDPYEVLGAIRDRAITRLLVPDVPNGGTDYVYAAPSGWTDLHSALEQTVSAYAYSATGSVAEADVVLGTDNVNLEHMVREVLTGEGLAAGFESASDEDLLKSGLGPSVPEDFRGWYRRFRERMAELPPAVRQRIFDQRFPEGSPAPVTQTYRALSVLDALGRLTPSSPRKPVPAEHEFCQR